MNYLGSKIRLSEFIEKTITQSISQPLSESSFCDLFAGTGAVGNHFHNKVKSIIYNDREYYSYVINKAFYSEIEEKSYRLMLDELNSLKETEGFIFQEYSEAGLSERLYFSEFNGKKIDAIRMRIEELYKNSVINENFYILLLATLLKAVDKVANTASVYCAFLKKLKKTALMPLKLIPIKTASHPTNYEIRREDSNALINNIKGDILYLDPPYNGREYGCYYHLLNTISLYNDKIQPKGKTGLTSYRTSRFCLKKEAGEALFELLKAAKYQHIFLSYNNEGIIATLSIEEMMKNLGTYQCSLINYPKFKSDKSNSKSHTIECIHHLIK